MAIDHAGRRRSVRPRHRRRPGRAQRQPGNRPDQRGLRPDPRTCSAGSSWTSARSTSTSIAASSCSTRPTAPPKQPAARSMAVAPTRPTRPRSAPTLSARRTRRANATSSPSSRSCSRKLFGPTKRAKNPRIRAILEAREGDANIDPHSADAAALAVPRSEPHQDRLHEAAAGGAGMPAELDLRTGGSEVAAARTKAEGPGLPGAPPATSCRTWSPTSAAR